MTLSSSVSKRVLLVVVLTCTTLLAVPVGRGQAYDELYFQPNISEWITGSYSQGSRYNPYYMDTVFPSNDLRQEPPNDLVFETRTLSVDQVYDAFLFKLYLTPAPSETAFWIRIIIASNEGHNEAVMFDSGTLKVTQGADHFERSLSAPPVTILAGQRLRIDMGAFIYNYPTPTILWGDRARPSSLFTNHAQYEGVPVPEFGFRFSVLLVLVVLVVSIVTRKRESTAPNTMGVPIVG